MPCIVIKCLPIRKITSFFIWISSKAEEWDTSRKEIEVPPKGKIKSYCSFSIIVPQIFHSLSASGCSVQSFHDSMEHAHLTHHLSPQPCSYKPNFNIFIQFKNLNKTYVHALFKRQAVQKSIKCKVFFHFLNPLIIPVPCKTSKQFLVLFLLVIAFLFIDLSVICNFFDSAL